MNTPSQLFMAFHKDQLHKKKSINAEKLSLSEYSPALHKEPSLKSVNSMLTIEYEPNMTDEKSG